MGGTHVEARGTCAVVQIAACARYLPLYYGYRAIVAAERSRDCLTRWRVCCIWCWAGWARLLRIKVPASEQAQDGD